MVIRYTLYSTIPSLYGIKPSRWNLPHATYGNETGATRFTLNTFSLLLRHGFRSLAQHG